MACVPSLVAELNIKVVKSYCICIKLLVAAHLEYCPIAGHVGFVEGADAVHQDVARIGEHQLEGDVGESWNVFTEADLIAV